MELRTEKSHLPEFWSNGISASLQSPIYVVGFSASLLLSLSVLYSSFTGLVSGVYLAMARCSFFSRGRMVVSSMDSARRITVEPHSRRFGQRILHRMLQRKNFLTREIKSRSAHSRNGGEKKKILITAPPYQAQ